MSALEVVLVVGVLLAAGAALILGAHLAGRRRRTDAPERRHRRTTTSPGAHTATGLIRRIDPRMLPQGRDRRRP